MATATTGPKGAFVSVASATDGGTLSNNANLTGTITGGPVGSLQTVSAAVDAGTLSNNANVAA
jgi:hypothetical protein